jgi:energy-coupling factor transport system permease protein
VKIHTWAWLGWLIAGLVVISSTRNPLYLIMFDLVLLILQASIKQSGRNLPITTLKFAASVLVLSTLFNTVISRFGDTVLLSIPPQIPLLSGPVTLEAVIFGFTNGLVLTGMFTLFTIINRVLPIQVIVRLIPQFLQPVALVTTIALTFIPATQKQFAAIREAQAIRGQRIQRLSDWLPLFIPLLIGGLERSMQIAEAMTARGFSASAKKKAPLQVPLLSIAALLMIISGWLLQLASRVEWFGVGLILTGFVLLIILFVVRSRQTRKTRYRQEKWSRFSSIVLTTVLLATSLFLFYTPGNASLVYEAYPRALFPSVAFIQSAALLVFLVPLVRLNGVDHD